MPRIVHGTLVAATVTTVTLDSDHNSVEVMNRSGSAEIFFTVDGTNPTVGGNDCDVLPAAINSIEAPAFKKGATVVKLISSGTPTFSVRGL